MTWVRGRHAFNRPPPVSADRRPKVAFVKVVHITIGLYM